MKKNLAIIPLLALLMVSLFANSTLNTNASTTNGPRITSGKGDVFVAKPDKTVRKAGPGEPLQDGETVMTGSNSEATITYPDGSQWTVGECSEFEVKCKPPPKIGWLKRLWKGACAAAGFVGDVLDIINPIKRLRDILGLKCLCRAFFNNETGISEISVFNDTVSVTAMRNEILIDSLNITGSLFFNEYGVPWAYVQEVTIYENGTISEPIEVLLDATEIAFTPYGSDSNGAPKVVYQLGEGIYVCGFGALLRPNMNVNVYLMPYNLSLIEYSPDKAIASTATRVDNWGNLPSTYLWKPLESKYIGEYNIWIDRDNNGYYDAGDMVNYLGVRAPPVGGIWASVDKLGLLAPYIGLASTILVATVATSICAKRVNRKKEKQ
jgi:hypothetical protein